MSKRAWIVSLMACLGLWQCAWMDTYLYPLTPGPPPNRSAQQGGDQYGDPLPPRAVARLGTERLYGPAAVSGLHFLDNDKRLISVHANDIAIWSAETGQLVNRIRGYQLNGPLDTSPDGQLIVAASDEGVHLFDADGTAVQQLSGPSHRRSAVPVFSPKGKAVAAAADGLRVRIWRVDDRELVYDMPGHTSNITALAYAPDSQRLVSASEKGSVRLWHAQDGKPIAHWKVFGGPITAIAYTPDSESIAVCDGRTIKLINSETGAVERTIKALGERVLDMAFVPNESRTLLVADSATLSFWDLEKGQIIDKRPGAGRAALARHGRIMATGEGRCVRLWVRRTGEELLWLNRHTEAIEEAGFINNGVVAYTRGEDDTLHLWDTTTGGHLKKVEARASAPSPDGRGIAVASGSALQLLDAAGGPPLWSGAQTDGEVKRLRWSPDGSLLGGVIAGKGVRVWEGKSGALKVRIKGSDTSTTKVAFSADSARVAMSERQSIFVHDSANGTRLSVLEGEHSLPITDLAMSPRGARLASVSREEAVVLWDTDKGARLDRIELSRPAISVGFSPDGQHIGLGFDDGHFELWHLPTRSRHGRFRPHEGGLNTLSFSGGGVVTAGDDARAIVWELSRLQPRRFFSPAEDKGGLPPGAVARLGSANLHHDAILTHVIQSSDWKSLVTADEAGALRVWDADTGDLKADLKGHDKPIKALQFSPDGRFLAAVDGGPKVFIWALDSAELLGTVDSLSANVEAIAFDSKGERLALGGGSRTIMIFNMETKEIDQELNIHTGDITGLAFSPYKNRLASSSLDGTAIVWELSKGAPLLRYKISDAGALAVAFSPKSRTMIASGADKSIKAFNMASGERLGGLTSYAPATSLTFIPKSDRFISAGQRYISMWDLKTLEEVVTFPVPEAPATSATFKPDGTVMISAAGEHAVRFWDLTTNEEMLIGVGHHRPITAIAHSPDGASLATGSEDKNLVLWDARTGRGKALLRGHKGTALALAFSPDGTKLASADAAGAVRTWTTSKGKPLRTLEGHSGKVSGLAFTPDGRTLWSAGEDGTVRMWNVVTGLQMSKLGGERTPITAMTLALGGQTLVYGDTDGLLHTWSSVLRKPLATLRGHVHPITELAIDKTGRLLASADKSGQIHIWRLDRGRIVASFEASDTRALVFSPEGRRIATLGGDIVHIWDIESGEELIQISGYKGEATDVIFSQDGKRLFSATTDTTVLVWDLAEATSFDEFTEQQAAIKAREKPPEAPPEKKDPSEAPPGDEKPPEPPPKDAPEEKK